MTRGPVGRSSVYLLLWLFFVLLIARLVLDYVQMFARSWRPSGPLLVIAEVVYTVTDPPLRALRKVIPPLRIGRSRLDLSFLVLVVLVQIAHLTWRTVHPSSDRLPTIVPRDAARPGAGDGGSTSLEHDARTRTTDD